MITHSSDLSKCKDDLPVKPSKEMVCVGCKKTEMLNGIFMLDSESV